MKLSLIRNTKKIVTVKFATLVVSVMIAGTALNAQPDLGAAGKGANPPNRDAAQREAQRAAKKANKDKQTANGDKLLDKLAEREAARQEQRLERVPKYLNAYSITDEKTQNAIMEHLKNTSSQRQEVAKAQYKLRRLLIVVNTIEPQIKEGSAALRKAEKDYEDAFQKSLGELDKKISYTKNARLEAALLALGALDPKGIIGAS